MMHPYPVGTLVTFQNDRSKRIGVVHSTITSARGYLYVIEPCVYEPWHRQPRKYWRDHLEVSHALSR